MTTRNYNRHVIDKQTRLMHRTRKGIGKSAEINTGSPAKYTGDIYKT